MYIGDCTIISKVICLAVPHNLLNSPVLVFFQVLGMEIESHRHVRCILLEQKHCNEGKTFLHQVQYEVKTCYQARVHNSCCAGLQLLKKYEGTEYSLCI
jgi:hypothetical protein